MGEESDDDWGMGDLVPVVNTLEDALRPEVVEWCNKQLALGESWDGVRKALGLMNSEYDKRWRLLRKELLLQRMPESPEENYANRYEAYEQTKRRLESQLAEIDRVLRDGVQITQKHNYFKARTDVMKLLLELNSKKDESYLGMRTTKQKEDELGKVKGGVTIIINSNVPRPVQEPIKTVGHDNQPEE